MHYSQDDNIRKFLNFRVAKTKRNYKNNNKKRKLYQKTCKKELQKFKFQCLANIFSINEERKIDILKLERMFRE